MDDRFDQPGAPDKSCSQAKLIVDLIHKVWGDIVFLKKGYHFGVE